MIQQLVLASSNKGKIAEIQAMLKHQNIEIVSQSHFDVPDAEETGTTFIAVSYTHLTLPTNREV